MQDNRRRIRDDGAKAYAKKKREYRRILMRWLILIGIAFALILIFVYIKEIKTQLHSMQLMLTRIEVLQYENEEMASGVTQEIDYISSVGTVKVDKPKQLNKEEVISTLKQLGESNPVIKEINENLSFYPENMLKALANNPEMADFVVGYLNKNENVICQLSQSEKEQEFPLFLQWDPRWGYQEYGNDSNIGLAGCGPTSLSMVLYSLTRDEMLTPDKIAAYAMNNNYYVDGSGTSWSFMEEFPQLYDVQVTRTKATERAIKDELDKGKLLICAMGEGDFTLLGHFIVIYGYNQEGFQINDSNCVARSRKDWAFSDIEKQIKSIWSYSKIY